MKYLIVFFITLHLLFAVTTTIQAAKGKDKDQVSVKVEGLGCPFCAYGLEKKFKEIKGIKDIRIEMETGVLTFSVPASLQLSQEIITKQVDQAGYTAVAVTIERANGEVITTAATSTANTTTTTTVTTETQSTAEFDVSGNCGMCKARIEQAAKGVEGILSAVWNAETQLLNIEYTGTSEVVDQVQSVIAKAGHDTDKFQAVDATYESLPPCCLYDRGE